MGRLPLCGQRLAQKWGAVFPYGTLVVDTQERLVGLFSRVDVLSSTELADLVEKMVVSGLKRVIVVDMAGKAAGMIMDGDLVVRIVPDARPGLLQVLTRRWGGNLRCRT